MSSEHLLCPQRLGLRADCANATDQEGRGITALENAAEDYWSHRGGNPGQCPVRAQPPSAPGMKRGTGEGPLHNVAGRCGLKIWKGDQHAGGALGAAGRTRPVSHLGEQPGCLQGGGGLPCHQDSTALLLGIHTRKTRHSAQETHLSRCLCKYSEMSSLHGTRYSSPPRPSTVLLPVVSVIVDYLQLTIVQKY